MVARGVAPLWATTRAQNDTPLVFLKNNQEINVQQWLCRARAAPAGALQCPARPWWRLGYYAWPLEEVLGPTARGRSLFKGAPGTVRPASPRHLSCTGGLGRGSGQSCAVCAHPGSSPEHPELALHCHQEQLRSQSSCNQTFASPTVAGCWLPAPQCLLAWWGERFQGPSE